MRRDKVLAYSNGYPDDLYAEDFGLWVELMLSEKIRFANLEETLLFYRSFKSDDRGNYYNRQKISTISILKRTYESIDLPMPSKYFQYSSCGHKIPLSDIKELSAFLDKIESKLENNININHDLLKFIVKREKINFYRRIKKSNFTNYGYYFYAKFILLIDKLKKRIC